MFNLKPSGASIKSWDSKLGFWVCSGAMVMFIGLAAADRSKAEDNAKDTTKKETNAAKPAEKEADHQLIEQLLTEIEELKARVHELESKKTAVGETAVTTETLATPVGVAVPALPGIPPGPANAAEAAQEDLSAPRGVQLRLFGDVGYHATDLHGDTNTFYIGSMDMLMTGHITDRFSVLGEVLFTSATDNSISVDVERLMLQYKHNDYFQLGVGRFHSSIGYYNPTYHRGAWFQTTIGRPFMYEFDDNGGFLPLQEIGASVSGNLPGEKLGLHYTAEVGNGRAHLLGSDPAQNNQDVNNGKAVNFALTARPSRLPGWEAGFSIYHDYLTFSDSINHPELIATAHLVYTNSTYEFLNEVMMVRHKYTSEGAPGVFHSPGFYTQFSRKFGKYRPYFRYSYFNAQNDEPIYGDPTDGSVVGRRNGPSVGIRWDFNDHAAVKLQYDRTSVRQTGLNTSYNGLATEFSFAF